jgi:hypothetical protein
MQYSKDNATSHANGFAVDFILSSFISDYNGLILLFLNTAVSMSVFSARISIQW